MSGTVLGLLLVLSATAADDLPPLDLHFWAVQADKTESKSPTTKAFDGPARTVKRQLDDLPHDRFTTVKHGALSAPFGQRTRVTLHDRYILFVEPQSRDREGRTRVRICLEMRSEQDPDKLVKALDSRVVISPDEPIRLGGLKLGEGELILVIKTPERESALRSLF